MDYEEQRKLALKLFQGEKYIELRKAIKDEECFDTLLPIAEEAGAIEFWDQFIEEWKYYVGRYWSITKEMLIEIFLELKNNEWTYLAGCDWPLPEKILIKAFLKLKDERCIYYAGCDWPLPKGMLIKAFLKLKEAKWIFWARRNWAIHKEMLIYNPYVKN